MSPFPRCISPTSLRAVLKRAACLKLAPPNPLAFLALASTLPKLGYLRLDSALPAQSISMAVLVRFLVRHALLDELFLPAGCIDLADAAAAVRHAYAQAPTRVVMTKLRAGEQDATLPPHPQQDWDDDEPAEEDADEVVDVIGGPRVAFTKIEPRNAESIVCTCTVKGDTKVVL